MGIQEKNSFVAVVAQGSIGSRHSLTDAHLSSALKVHNSKGDATSQQRKLVEKRSRVVMGKGEKRSSFRANSTPRSGK